MALLESACASSFLPSFKGVFYVIDNPPVAFNIDADDIEPHRSIFDFELIYIGLGRFYDVNLFFSFNGLVR